MQLNIDNTQNVGCRDIEAFSINKTNHGSISILMKDNLNVSEPTVLSIGMSNINHQKCP